MAGVALKWIVWDDHIINNMTADELEAYVDDRSNYGSIEWHIPGWGVPFVTNHKYKFNFGLLGTNFEFLEMRIPQHYQDDSHSIYLVHNFTNNREEFNVTKDGVLKINDTIPDVPDRYVLG
jgi:hypothetical protein